MGNPLLSDYIEYHQVYFQTFFKLYNLNFFDNFKTDFENVRQNRSSIVFEFIYIMFRNIYS